MRTFVAVPIPSTFAIRAVLRELAGMRPAIRLVPEDQLHVTVKFLGDTDELKVPELLNCARQIAWQELSRSLNLKGLGAFPRLDRPSVLWVGFEDSQLLSRMAAKLDEHCRAFGYEPESRPFQAHVTLGRIKSDLPRDLPEYLLERQTADLGSANVTCLELFRSDLSPGGPVYTTLGSAPLMKESGK